MNLQKRYRLLKMTTIVMGAFYAPLSMYIGYCFGSGQYLVGCIALGGEVLMALIDGLIFWRLLEKLNGK